MDPARGEPAGVERRGDLCRVAGAGPVTDHRPGRMSRPSGLRFMLIRSSSEATRTTSPSATSPSSVLACMTDVRLVAPYAVDSARTDVICTAHGASVVFGGHVRGRWSPEQADPPS